MILFFHTVFVFFFKQKTAYEMRISDWSSDVCSSDLWGGGGRGDPRTRSRGRPSQPPRPSADDDAADRPGRAGREDPRTGPEDERGGRALAWPVGRDAECGTGTGERPGAGGPSQPPAARNRAGGDRAYGA